MNPNPSIPPGQLEEIERYLQQAMSHEEEQAFVTRMNNDPQLKEWTDELRFLLVGVQEAALQQRLEKFHTGMATETPMEKSKIAEFRTFRKWMAAASILLILTLSVWLLFSRNGKPQGLFAEYFRPDPGLLSAMGNSDNYPFDRAMIDYKTGNYEASIRAWDSLQRIHPGNDTLNYFIGSALLASHQPGKAIPYYKKVMDRPNSYFADDANWYLGLALLETGQPQAAIPFIKKSNHPRQQELLDKLKK